MQVKGAEQLKPWEESKPENFLAGGEWPKVTLGTVNKEMFCLLCVGTKLLVLQTCLPTVALVLEEVASRWQMLVNRHFSPFPSCSWGFRMELVSGKPRVPMS